MTRRKHILGFATMTDQYVFLYDGEDLTEVLQTLIRFANDPELDLSWRQAKNVAQYLRSQVEEDEDAHRGHGRFS